MLPPKRNTTMRKAILLAVGAAALLIMGGCRQDMHDQPKYIPLRASQFFPDGRSARPIVADTVPRGPMVDDSYIYTGEINGAPGRGFPFQITKDDLDRGQQRFNIYCAPCHSEVGDGHGMIVQRGYLKPPSFHIPRLINAPEGYIFKVITHGLGGMPDYAQQISVEDRWKIIAYMRALQLSWQGKPGDVPQGTTIGPPTAPPPPEPGKAGREEVNSPREVQPQ